YFAQVYNTTRMTTEDRSTIANNQSTVLNAWTPDNQNTMIAERRPTSIYYNNKPDSRKVEGSSFLRGLNFVLGYTLPKSMPKKWYMEKLRIYASAQNLFCITGYSGYDPEIRTYPGYDGNVFAQNMDFYGYPKPRTFTFGLNVTF
ncbi:MAG: SusC/RagA family TonB-linked outer membrane protein, partial [Tannerellaceae bacterium]|nr:SusC/RagA family TonB-linked outer membrane protein [Tannerellaceae bacterium]